MTSILPPQFSAIPSAAPHIASDSQRSAIEADVGPVLVLAGPGAGKTFCLIERIRFLVEKKGIDPAHICAFTFTNPARFWTANNPDFFAGTAVGPQVAELLGTLAPAGASS